MRSKKVVVVASSYGSELLEELVSDIVRILCDWPRACPQSTRYNVHNEHLNDPERNTVRQDKE